MYLGFPTYLYIGVVLEELLQAFVRQSICPNRFWGSFLVPRSQFSLKEQRRRQRGYGGDSTAVTAMAAAQQRDGGGSGGSSLAVRRPWCGHGGSLEAVVAAVLRWQRGSAEAVAAA
jgi:hypothetical protein